jgi:hypothetical protein
MRRVHWAVENKIGRLVTRTFLNTRISGGRWDPVPVPPADAAAKVAPTPLLIVHGDADEFFPVEHAHQLYRAANEPKELWIEAGFGHAESAANTGLLDRIGRWVVTSATAAPSVSASPNAVA